MDEAEEAIADLVDSMEAYGGEPPELLEEVFKPEVPTFLPIKITMIVIVIIVIGQGGCVPGECSSERSLQWLQEVRILDSTNS